MISFCFPLLFLLLFSQNGSACLVASRLIYSLDHAFSIFHLNMPIVAVNTKVDMRFNVKQAHWLSERVRERILQMVVVQHSLHVSIFNWSSSIALLFSVLFNPLWQTHFVECVHIKIRYRFHIYLQEKNRINKDGEIVISSTKTRTQK